MGITFSCPGADSAFDNSIDAVLMRSISFKNDDILGSSRSTSINSRDPETPSIFKALGSGKMIIEGSLSFKARNSGPFSLETELSFRAAEADEPIENEAESIKHDAAVKMQSVYKSFRTRRKLADCAVVAEQRWRSLVDSAMLARSSVSFFDVDQPESIVSRWDRATRRAAKVGKGLSKDKKARKLALQHWLEAIDHRHRYGHNLQFYYLRWLHCDSRQHFFHWLDVGEGRDENLEQCPRWKLQQQCIKYLGEKEREAFEVMVEGGKLIYKQSLEPVDTSGIGAETKWIFVLSTSKTLYVGQKKKGTFQHSSFLAGGATSAAGRLVVERGTLKAVWPHSGHYRPTQENFQELIDFLKDKNVDLTDVKKNPSEDEEESFTAEYTISSEFDGDINLPELDDGSTEIFETPTSSSNEESEEEHEEKKNMEDLAIYHKKNLFFEEQGGGASKNAPPVLKKKIMERISSKKEMGSYQLGRQISFKWTTGAGPRIGCVRDYPTELQLHALEQVCLSPKGDKIIDH